MINPQDSGNRDAAKVLRMLRRTFSWLMVQAAAGEQ